MTDYDTIGTVMIKQDLISAMIYADIYFFFFIFSHVWILEFHFLRYC